MTRRRDWRRAKRHRNIEFKDAGKILDNGVTLPAVPRDHLAYRAERELRRWGANLSRADRELLLGRQRP
jgi:hypothetical protein